VLWERVESTAREIFALYQFEEIRTPVFEQTELFARGVGADTDIVSKEMYSFEDRDGKSLTLRPEGTAPVVRACLEHQLHQDGGVQKLFYLGPMFRRERPQKGRYRQFHQIGAEVLGEDRPAVEAEVLEMLQLFLARLGVGGYSVLVNSIGCASCRPRFLEKLRSELLLRVGALCPDCQRRSEANPLRVLDCKIESCQPVISELPSILDFLDPDCRQHFDQFRSYLRQRSIPFEVVPRLVRGLDYYMRTTFEITTGALGAQNTLIGGGRYDGLSEAIGGPPLKGFGFAMGIERLVLLLEAGGTKGARPLPLFLAPLGEAAFEKATRLAMHLRSRNLPCGLDFEPRSLKSAMRLANRSQAAYVLILGDRELETGQYQLKRMADGTQFALTEEELLQYPF
jgi:histidyl-tRNA synthetase